MALSRGDSVSGYLPGFDGTSGIKLRLNELKGQAISGTCISGEVTYAVAHQLGAIPSMVIVAPLLTAAETVCTISAGVVAQAAASAATSAAFYVVGNLDGIKYKAFLLL